MAPNPSLLTASCLLVLGVCSTYASSTWSWSQLSLDSNTTSAPAKRLGALVVGPPSSSSPSANSPIVIHGGCSSSCCYAPLGDAWSWTPGSGGGGGWTNLSSASSPVPQGRLYHTASPAEKSATFYMFGGANEQTGFLGDLWLLDASSVFSSSPSPFLTWSLLEAAAPPCARSGHTQVAIPSASGSSPYPPGSFVLFGGDNGTNILDDVWVFSPPSTWTPLPSASLGGPGARTQHAATAVVDADGGAWMVISGGSDYLGRDQADVWAMDVASGKWVQLGAPPAPSSPNPPPWPLERHGHEIWAAPQGQNGEGTEVSLYLFGGQHGTSDADPYLGDLWLFTSGGNGTFALLEQGTTQPSSTQPVNRGLGGIVAGGEGVVWFGGFSGYEGGTADLLHNDVWEFSF
jgi:hypothetical protein